VVVLVCNNGYASGSPGCAQTCPRRSFRAGVTPRTAGSDTDGCTNRGDRRWNMDHSMKPDERGASRSGVYSCRASRSLRERLAETRGSSRTRLGALGVSQVVVIEDRRWFSSFTLVRLARRLAPFIRVALRRMRWFAGEAHEPMFAPQRVVVSGGCILSAGQSGQPAFCALEV